jgi:hypothetical protein
VRERGKEALLLLPLRREQERERKRHERREERNDAASFSGVVSCLCVVVVVVVVVIFDLLAWPASCFGQPLALQAAPRRCASPCPREERASGDHAGELTTVLGTE